MASRASLELRASRAGVTAANYPNDSKLEQAVLYAEKNATPGTAEVKATATLTLSGNAVAGETVTIAGKVYTWVANANLNNANANEVVVGAAATNSLDNLAAAIRANPTGRGTLYSVNTTKHPQVNVSSKTSSTVVIQVERSGTKGNALQVAETMTNGSWGSVSGGVNGSGPKARNIQATSGDRNV